MDQETNQRSVLNTLMSPAASMTADATIAIIAEEGFDRVSVRSVAARLGVAPGHRSVPLAEPANSADRRPRPLRPAPGRPCGLS